MRAELAAKMPLVMTTEDWRRYNSATECHVCNGSLQKADFETRYTCTTPTPAGTSVKARKGAITEKLAKTAKRENCSLRRAFTRTSFFFFFPFFFYFFFNITSALHNKSNQHHLQNNMSYNYLSGFKLYTIYNIFSPIDFIIFTSLP